MWLLKTEGFRDGPGTLSLVQFWADAVPPYAILSHRWSSDPSDEISFSDIKYLTGALQSTLGDAHRKAILQKPGLDKLFKAITKACRDDWEYIWIDTCCIDKDSSVELSEAINSMYRYYEQAQVCYAYLGDVTDDPETFERSVYFTRGWTLQELLAPSYLIFTDKNWNDIGTKYSRCDAVARCTGIAPYYLLGEVSIFTASIAERMSWAASRKLSREEDVAYCLLGIFQVNMYQLYGEGKQRAFLRLQEEILKQSEDQSIFAWTKSEQADLTIESPEQIHFLKPHGMLADGPEDFRHSSNIKPYVAVQDMTPPTMTAKGLRMTLPLFPGKDNLLVAPLYCATASNGYDGFVAIYLRKLANRPNSYVRVRFHETLTAGGTGQLQEVYVVQNMHYTTTQRIYPFHDITFAATIPASDDLPRARGSYHMTECDVGPTNGVERRSDALAPKATVSWDFKANKQPGSLTAALLVQYFTEAGDVLSSIGIRLGLTTDFSLSWDIVQDPSSSEWYSEFSAQPQPLNRTVDLEWHLVTVSVREEIKDGRKQSYVKMTITPRTALLDAFEESGDPIPQAEIRPGKKLSWRRPFTTKKIK